ncbi:uncharacterized protein LOC127787680 [Diospyros lotus]|uniref:uncharacterized protein LOC127787680 n=1 Tax=Diospyros lotus TaxID=55363 RepID=UPI002256F533|nr:uncharacterized protein LOC127787680 [Diospyros lotus]
METVTELVAALDQATQMAKQLPATTDPSHLLQIYAALHSAHHRLSSFLSHPHPPPAPAVAENSLASAAGDGEPMQLADDDNREEAEAETATVDSVQERMRDCFIQNKRPKRPLSPSSAAAAELRRRPPPYDDGFLSYGFDPLGTKLRSLDLIYQFHC